jgi:hypothetical protein
MNFELERMIEFYRKGAKIYTMVAKKPLRSLRSTLASLRLKIFNFQFSTNL